MTSSSPALWRLLIRQTASHGDLLPVGAKALTFPLSQRRSSLLFQRDWIFRTFLKISDVDETRIPTCLSSDWNDVIQVIYLLRCGKEIFLLSVSPPQDRGLLGINDSPLTGVEAEAPPGPSLHALHWHCGKSLHKQWTWIQTQQTCSIIFWIFKHLDLKSHCLDWMFANEPAIIWSFLNCVPADVRSGS